MKAIKLTFLGLVLICTTFFSSCKKDEIIMPSFNANSDESKLLGEIIRFKKSMIDTRKSTEYVKVSDAILLMEGSFNLYHGFLNENYSEDITDSIIVDFAYNEADTITTSELSDIFLTINNGIYDAFINCSFPAKHVKYFDLELKSTPQGNQLITLVCIGHLSNNKKSSLAGTGIWPNATPFNSQQGQLWATNTSSWEYLGQNVVTYDVTSPAPSAINAILVVPNQNSTTFIYRVENTGYMWNPLNNLSSLYIQNPDVAGPDNEIACSSYSGCFFVINGLWYPDNYQFQWCGSSQFSSFVDYKHMNKYFNVCMAAIKTHKPYDKEAIDAKFATAIADVFYYTFYRDVWGTFKVTYASKYKYKEFEPVPCSDPSKL